MKDKKIELKLAQIRESQRLRIGVKKGIVILKEEINVHFQEISKLLKENANGKNY